MKPGSEKQRCILPSTHLRPLDFVPQDETTSFPKQDFHMIGGRYPIKEPILGSQEANSKVHRWPNRPIATVIDSSATQEFPPINAPTIQLIPLMHCNSVGVFPIASSPNPLHISKYEYRYVYHQHLCCINIYI